MIKKECPPGILLADKPSGPGSASLVGRVRKISGCKKAGHCGTLDRFASGLMILPLGGATSLAELFLHQDKEYEATFALGRSTDTHDPQGETLEEWEEKETREFLDASREKIFDRIAGFIHQKSQIPPLYSALKKEGRRFSDRARQGDTRLPESRPVRILESLCTGIDEERMQVFARFKVGSGTYIRSIARDLSDQLRIPLHLHALRRTRIGSFSLAGERIWDTQTEEIQPLSLAEALPDWPVLEIQDPVQIERVSHGNQVALEFLPSEGSNFFLVNGEGRVLAWALSRGNDYGYRRVF